MRFREIVAEAKAKAKMTKRQKAAAGRVNSFYDASGTNTDYTAYRVGLAVAATDGKTKPDIDPESWIGKRKTAHPYTKEEQDMLKMAYAAVGAGHQNLNANDEHSRELDSTNKVSPVSKKKPNKYGV